MRAVLTILLVGAAIWRLAADWQRDDRPGLRLSRSARSAA